MSLWIKASSKQLLTKDFMLPQGDAMQYRVKQTQTDTLCPTQHRRECRKWQGSATAYNASWHPLALSLKHKMSHFMTLSFQNHKGLYWACENVISNRQPADRKCSLATDRHWCKTASHEMSHACMNKQNTQAYTHTHKHKSPWVPAPLPSNVDLNLARHDKSFLLSFYTNSFIAEK